LVTEFADTLTSSRISYSTDFVLIYIAFFVSYALKNFFRWDDSYLDTSFISDECYYPFPRDWSPNYSSFRSWSSTPV